MRVLIAPDKFKGTLTALEAAEAIAAGWRQVRPEDELELFPISDGGDGFGELLGRQLGAEPQEVETVDAAQRPVRATWWWQPLWRTAVIESASVIGLALLPPGKYHPFDLDTRGLAAVLRAAAAKHPRLWLIGIGGSATNDGGFGLARALGWGFWDRRGQPIERWTDLTGLARVERPARPLRFRQINVAVDVSNRLLGVWGATRVFGPQKGLRPEDFKPAERCLRRLVRVLHGCLRLGCERHKLPGAGAAGGLGFGLNVFLGAPLLPGFKLFSAQTQFRERLRDFDLVITGEGAVDLSSVVMGKGVGGVARAARRFKVPCLGLAGTIRESPSVRPSFTWLRAISPTLAPREEAMSRAAFWLGELAKRAAMECAVPGVPGGDPGPQPAR